MIKKIIGLFINTEKYLPTGLHSDIYNHRTLQGSKDVVYKFNTAMYIHYLQEQNVKPVVKQEFKDPLEILFEVVL